MTGDSDVKHSKAMKAAILLTSTALLSPGLQAQPVSAEPPVTALEDQFRDPPQTARPRVWWHWMNGNIAKDAIAKDLAWMKRVGIGGVHNFDAGLATPQVVDTRLAFMTPDWKDAFRFAANEADRLGLELGIAASPGWSETGGPWVVPADGMKKLTWAETVLPGGKRFRGRIAAAPDSTGPFQTQPYAEEMPAHDGADFAKPKAAGAVAVLAIPAGEAALPVPGYSLDDGAPLSAASLADSDLGSEVRVPFAARQAASVVATYPSAVTVRSVRVFLPGIKLPFRGVPITAALEVREGEAWRHVADLPLSSVPTTRAVPSVTGRQFRLLLTNIGGNGNLDQLNAAPGAFAFDAFAQGPMDAIRLGDFQLFADQRVDRAEEKAGFETVLDYGAIVGPDSVSGAPDAGPVIDLSDRVKPDGTIDWTPPKGRNWRLLSFGWSLTGKTNHPAPPEATGLEVDKFDAAAVRRYLETYLGKYRETVGAGLIGKHGVKALVTDSIEVGRATWTGAMEAEFAARRGYPLRPWLPALAGFVVGSADKTERFLFDYRQTLTELMADRHYATVAAVAHENGLTVYGEALEDKRALLGDDLNMRRFADVPMAAMWTYGDPRLMRSTLIGDMRGAASVAHVYGKPFVAAESLTSVNAPWDFSPASLKKVIDLEFASGINRPVIHTSVHQPSDDKVPGISLAIFGQYFNRHESWAGLARPWVDYMARSSYLLQQGRNVAEVAWFIGEESPITALYATQAPAGLPSVHAWDFVNAEMLANAMSVDGNALVTPGGARYRALYLGGTSRRMTLPTLRRLAELVRGGATLIGQKPEATPSAADDQGQFAALANALWGGEAGRGRVIASDQIDSALAMAGIAPALSLDGAPSDAQIMSVHRTGPEGELWFLNNRRPREERLTARFRVTGKMPELWHAEDGRIEPLSYRIENGETLVPLTLAAEDAVFVVFRKTAVQPFAEVKPAVLAPVAELAGPWTVRFQPGRGAPAAITVPVLASLGDNADPGVKYFSGEATYSRTMTLPKGVKPGAPLWLDLGQVAEIAEVRVNGKIAGYAWHKPYRVEVGSALRKGLNTIEVKVANLWVNRLIGDAQPGASKVTWTSMPTYRADAPLRPSGLIGPVTLVQERR